MQVILHTRRAYALSFCSLTLFPFSFYRPFSFLFVARSLLSLLLIPSSLCYCSPLLSIAPSFSLSIAPSLFSLSLFPSSPYRPFPLLSITPSLTPLSLLAPLSLTLSLSSPSLLSPSPYRSYALLTHPRSLLLSPSLPSLLIAPHQPKACSSHPQSSRTGLGCLYYFFRVRPIMEEAMSRAALGRMWLRPTGGSMGASLADRRSKRRSERSKVRVGRGWGMEWGTL